MPDLIFPQPMTFKANVTPLLGQYLYNELINEIEKSKLIIRAVQYQWKWNIYERYSKIQMLGATIIRARKRNIPVQIILNTESPSKHLTKINSVTNNQLSREGCNIKMLNPVGLLHTKLWIFDNKTVFVGSHNISTRSLTVNEETTVKIESKSVANFFNLYFDNLWGSR
jgi:phosphatidylserine/phosphatidylglycerophosphate/cardiolipin synthase-like enzyme